MRVRALVLGLCAVAVLGCGRESSAPGADQSTERATPSDSTALDQAQTAAQLGELTQAVRRYAAEQRSVPKTLADLIPKGYLQQVPAAPAGKKFAIDKNLQVKLVAE
jgi:hypothetical protein